MKLGDFGIEPKVDSMRNFLFILRICFISGLIIILYLTLIYPIDISITITTIKTTILNIMNKEILEIENKLFLILLDKRTHFINKIKNTDFNKLNENQIKVYFEYLQETINPIRIYIESIDTFLSEQTFEKNTNEELNKNIEKAIALFSYFNV
jgi:hypothetical protein